MKNNYLNYTMWRLKKIVLIMLSYVLLTCAFSIMLTDSKNEIIWMEAFYMVAFLIMLLFACALLGDIVDFSKKGYIKYAKERKQEIEENNRLNEEFKKYNK